MRCFWFDEVDVSWGEGQLVLGTDPQGQPDTVAAVYTRRGILIDPGRTGQLNVLPMDWSEQEIKTIRVALRCGYRITLVTRRW